MQEDWIDSSDYQISYFFCVSAYLGRLPLQNCQLITSDLSKKLPDISHNSSVVRQKGESQIVLQENKARQYFRKNEHSLPPDTHTYVAG